MRRNECTKDSLLLVGRCFLGLGRRLGSSLAFGGGLGLDGLGSKRAAACAAARWAASAASSAARSVSATSVPPLARNSASSGERATSTLISTVTSGWRWTLILCVPSALIGLSSSTWPRSILTPGGGTVGDVARGDRAVELQGLGGLADQRDLEVGHLGGHRLGVLAALEVLRLQRLTLRFEVGDVVLGGAQRLLLRQQEVAGEAGLHLHHIAHLTKLGARAPAG